MKFLENHYFLLPATRNKEYNVRFSLSYTHKLLVSWFHDFSLSVVASKPGDIIRFEIKLPRHAWHPNNASRLPKTVKILRIITVCHSTI